MPLTRLPPDGLKKDAGRFEVPGIATGSFLVQDEGAPLGAPVTSLNVVGDNASVSVSGSVARLAIVGGGGGTDQIGVYGLDQGLPVGTGTNLNVGSNLGMTLSGTTLLIEVEPTITGSIKTFDEQLSNLRSHRALRFIGSGTVLSSVAGGDENLYPHATIQIDEKTPTRAGGTGTDGAAMRRVDGLDFLPPLSVRYSGVWGTNFGEIIFIEPATGTVVVYDENTLLGSFPQMRFIGGGVAVYNSGSYAAIGIVGGSGTRLNVREPEPLVGITGLYWRVPSLQYAAGSLGLAINGVTQTPGSSFAEQFPASGTYQLLSRPATGSVHVAAYGVDASGGGGGTLVALDDGVLLGIAQDIDFGDNLTVSLSGTRVRVDAAAGGGGGVDQIGVYGLDDGAPVGTGTWFDAGDSLDLSLSGTVLRMDVAAATAGWDPNAPPVTGSARDDEFGANSDPTGTLWTVFDPGGAMTYFEAPDGLHVQYSTSLTDRWMGFLQSMPTGAFVATLHFHIATRQANEVKVALIMADDKSGAQSSWDLATFQIGFGGYMVARQVEYWYAYNSFSGTYYNQSDSHGTEWGWVQLRRNSSGLGVSYSQDGFNWMEMTDPPDMWPPGGGTNKYVGFGVRGSLNPAASVVFDYFRVQEGTDYDEYDYQVPGRRVGYVPPS